MGDATPWPWEPLGRYQIELARSQTYIACLGPRNSGAGGSRGRSAAFALGAHTPHTPSPKSQVACTSRCAATTGAMSPFTLSLRSARVGGGKISHSQRPSALFLKRGPGGGHCNLSSGSSRPKRRARCSSGATATDRNAEHRPRVYPRALLAAGRRIWRCHATIG